MTLPDVKVLLTGCRGQVGWEFCERASDLGSVSVVPTDIHNLDITDREAVKALIADEDVDVVVNAAAYTAVDKAESEEDLAYTVNVTGPENLAIEARDAEMRVYLYFTSQPTMCSMEPFRWHIPRPVLPDRRLPMGVRS